MAEKHAPPPLPVRNDEDTHQFILGFADCLFAFGVGLADRGYIEREALAAIFENLTEQHKARDDSQHPARQYTAKYFAHLFRANVTPKPS